MPPSPQVVRLKFTRFAAGNVANYVRAAWTTNIALIPPAVWIERAPVPVAPQRNGRVRVFSHEDRDCLALILQGKRLGFTLTENREMLAARARGDCTKNLPINRTKCVEQIKMLERQRRDIDRALAELRRIYTDIFIVSDVRPAGASGPI